MSKNQNVGLKAIADFSWGTPTPEFRRLMERVLRPVPDDGNPTDVATEAKENPAGTRRGNDDIEETKDVSFQW